MDSSSSGKDDWLNAKAQKAKEKKRKAALQKCEGRIHELEEDLKEIENEFLKPELQRDAAALLQLQRRKEADEEELEGLYEEWEALASEEDV